MVAFWVQFKQVTTIMVSAHTTPSNIPFLILESDYVYVMHVKDAYYVAEAASGRIKVNPVF